jgi:hypothetical protein
MRTTVDLPDALFKQANIAAVERGTSVVRFKVFTLDDRLILGNIGRLESNDRAVAGTALRRLFDLRLAT